MTGYFQAFELDDVEKKHSETGQAYSEFLRRRGMSVGLYSLSAGGEDLQHPHASDEMYLVLRGQANLQVGDQTTPVKQGSIISVDHGEDHRFTDITEDLQLLVVFAPPDEED
jgi:quercetin dioxygenase-like cupin family protein